MKQRIQGIIMGFLVAALVFGSITTVMAAATMKKIDAYYDNYQIYVDGVLFEATDKNGKIEPFSYNGWIYAPFEHIAKALGKNVRWDGNTKSLYIGNDTIAETSIALMDLDWFNSSNSKGGLVDYKNVKDNFGDIYSSGIGGRTGTASNWNDYKIDGTYKNIKGRIVLNYDFRSEKKRGDTFVYIYGDNKLLYKSPDIYGGVEPVDFNVDITGVKTLRVEIFGSGFIRMTECKLYK